MQIESPIVSQEGYYWIKIEPISDKVVGENFTITSTTNVYAGEEILVQIYSSTFFPGPKMQTREFYGATGTVRVVQGIKGNNLISFVVNSSTLFNSSPLKPDEYIVSEDAIRQDASTGVLFNVLPAPVSSGKTTLKPKNFIDWERLDLPPIKVNNSMQPEIPKQGIVLYSNPSQPGQMPHGSIVFFSSDGIVRIFDKNGTRIAAYFDFRSLHSAAVPSGFVVGNPMGNVSIVTFEGERILTEIFEAGD